jgi:hypothetical protein
MTTTTMVEMMTMMVVARTTDRSSTRARVLSV